VELVGLRDRAFIAVMAYSFARVNAMLEMKMRYYQAMSGDDEYYQRTIELLEE